MRILAFLLLALAARPGQAQPDTTQTLRRLGLSVHTGFIIPHSRELRPLSQTRPLGVELSYSRLPLSRRAWGNGNCFARTGAYLSYKTFNNPAVLGQTVSAGGFFEPLLVYGGRLSASVRATAGLAYLSRVYHPQTNPENTFFSSPVSGLLGLSLHAAYALTPQLDLTAAASYNHISNGGIRQPNKGMNFPTLAVGLAWQPQRAVFPDYRSATKRPQTNRWAGRLQAFGSVNVLPATSLQPETPKPLFGASLTGVYRLNHVHALAVGPEVVADEAVRERIRRDGADRRARQLALLAGYELWQGRYRFGIQAGYHLVHPGTPYSDRFYQRYQLLYRLPSRFTLGVGLRAAGHVAKGFDLRFGREMW